MDRVTPITEVHPPKAQNNAGFGEKLSGLQGAGSVRNAASGILSFTGAETAQGSKEGATTDAMARRIPQHADECGRCAAGGSL